MKKILFAAALLAFGFANAQEETTISHTGFAAGDIIATGSVAFGTSKTGNQKNTNFNVAPAAAYFVTNNIAVGLDLGYSHGTEKGINYNEVGPVPFKVKYNAFNAGAFARYYFTPAAKFSIFAQLSAGYGTSKSEDNYSDLESKVNGFNAGVAPGFNYFLSDHIALQTTFGFLSYSTSKPKTISPDGNFEGNSTNNFSLGLNLSNIYFGVLYKF